MPAARVIFHRVRIHSAACCCCYCCCYPSSALSSVRFTTSEYKCWLREKRNSIHVSRTSQADVRDFHPPLLFNMVGGSLRWVTQLSKIAVTQFQDQTHTVNEESALSAQISGNPPGFLLLTPTKPPNKDKKRIDTIYIQRERKNNGVFSFLDDFR